MISILKIYFTGCAYSLYVNKKQQRITINTNVGGNKLVLSIENYFQNVVHTVVHNIDKPIYLSKIKDLNKTSQKNK